MFKYRNTIRPRPRKLHRIYWPSDMYRLLSERFIFGAVCIPNYVFDQANVPEILIVFLILFFSAQIYEGDYIEPQKFYLFP